MLVPKLLLGNPVNEALGNRSCVALPPASMQVAASRVGKLELLALNSQAGAWELANPRSHALRGNAVPDALRPVLARCAFLYTDRDSRRSAPLTAFPRSAWERECTCGNDKTSFSVCIMIPYFAGSTLIGILIGMPPLRCGFLLPPNRLVSLLPVEHPLPKLNPQPPCSP